MFRRALFFSAFFVLAVAVGRFALIRDTNIALFWPAVGVLTWWALSARSRGELALVIATIGVVITPWYVLEGFSWKAATALSVANIVASVGTRVCVVALAHSRLPPDKSQNDPPAARAGWYMFRLRTSADLYCLQVAAFGAVAVGALIGMGSLALSGHPPTMADYLAWFFRHLSGVVVVTGLGLAVTSAPRTAEPPHWTSVLRLTVITVVTFVVVFWVGMALPVGFAGLLPLFWSATRMPVTVSMLHATVVSLAMIVLSMLLPHSPFGGTDDPWFIATSVQIFAILAGSFALTLAMAIHESRRLYAELLDQHELTRRQATELEAITETIPDGLLIVDSQGRTELVNRAGAELASSAFLDGVLMSDVPRGDLATVKDGAALPSTRALRGETVRSHEMTLEDGEPDPRVYDVSAAPLFRDDSEAPDRALLLFRDVTEKHRAVAQIESARRHAERLFTDAPHGIVEVDAGGRILSANTAFAHLTGRTAAELTGRNVTELTAPGDHLSAHLASVVASPGALMTTDCTLLAGAGRDHRVAITSRTLEIEDASTVLMHIVDVSERHRYEELLAHLADHDALTGLANRRLFDAELRLHMEAFRRDGRNGAMLLIDLDRFKEVNDTRGHAAGDRLLVSLAQLLQSHTRGTDVVARLGGDEFAVILPGADEKDLASIADSLVDAIGRHTREIGGAAAHVTASIGGVTFAVADAHRTDPMVLADMLMYDAKESGRDTSVVLSSADDDKPRTGARIEWKHRIEEALAEDRFLLHLQPILELTTGRITGAEALVRLVDGDVVVPPGTFVPIAEEVGLAPQVDLWVLRAALALLPELRHHDPDFRLSVNMSGRSIVDPEFASAVTAELAADPARAAAMTLELTETAVVGDVSVAREFAETISATGVRFALDDFGAGFGSYHYLKHLIFDYVKIDGEFISDLDSSAVDRSIVESIVGVAHELGKQVIAEHVRSAEILALVRARGIAFAQGFEIGPPIPIDDFIGTHLGKEE